VVTPSWIDLHNPTIHAALAGVDDANATIVVTTMTAIRTGCVMHFSIRWYFLRVIKAIHKSPFRSQPFQGKIFLVFFKPN